MAWGKPKPQGADMPAKEKCRNVVQAFKVCKYNLCKRLIYPDSYRWQKSASPYCSKFCSNEAQGQTQRRLWEERKAKKAVAVEKKRFIGVPFPHRGGNTILNLDDCGCELCLTNKKDCVVSENCG